IRNEANDLRDRKPMRPDLQSDIKSKKAATLREVRCGISPRARINILRLHIDMVSPLRALPLDMLSLDELLNNEQVPHIFVHAKHINLAGEDASFSFRFSRFQPYPGGVDLRSRLSPSKTDEDMRCTARKATY